jgi:endonuclease YncB( thermonuclease family)
MGERGTTRAEGRSAFPQNALPGEYPRYGSSGDRRFSGILESRFSALPHPGSPKPRSRPSHGVVSPSEDLNSKSAPGPSENSFPRGARTGCRGSVKGRGGTLLLSQNWYTSRFPLTVSDGDTITVLHDKSPVKTRLYGIDCPEKRQAFGTRAKQFTSDLVFGKVADVETIDVDRHGRTVGILRLSDGTVVNQEIIRAGFGWVYARHCKKPICVEWKRLESEAATAKPGLWKDDKPVPPWEWRRQERNKR